MGFVMSPSDSTLFNPGEVWEWHGQHMYLLLRREFDKEVSFTVRSDNQQAWSALNLSSGDVLEVRMHTSVFWDDAKWTRLS